MSKQTEALKLALEALEDVDGIDTETECVTIDVGEAITAIREALAEQPAQEPVAWRAKNATPPGGYVLFQQYPQAVAERGGEIEPLYTSPPPRKPLTDEQIDRAIAEIGLNYFADAANNRAVLRELCKRAAHGIKGEA